MNESPGDSWDRYWAHGFLTSCADAYKGNYEGSMRAFWERRFAALPDGSRLLDICTGNGAIALIAAASARAHEREYEIDAIDLAEIHPERAVDDDARGLLDGIRFHSRTDICKTGFDNDRFDLVTGHFALEYADREAAVKELARVTAAGGEHLFVMHGSESVILKTAAVELDHIALLQDCGLLDKANEVIRMVGTASTAEKQILGNVPEAERRRTALNEAAGAVSAAIRQSPHPEILRTALGHVSESYRLLQSTSVEQALQRLQQGRAEIEANAGRLNDLQRAASTTRDLASLGEMYADLGFTEFEIDELTEPSAGLIGWTVRARHIEI